MRRLVAAAVWMGCATTLVRPAYADRVPVPVRDSAVEQTVWIGSFRHFVASPVKPGDLFYADARLRVTKRNGEEVEAELWIAQQSKGLALRGRISRGGSLNLRATKVLKGEWPAGLVSQTRFAGDLKRKRMRFVYEVPGEHPCRGECNLQLASWLSGA